MALLIGFDFGPFEFVMERHPTVGPKFFSWDNPSTGEIVVDCGKFSCMVTHKGYWRQSRERLRTRH